MIDDPMFSHTQHKKRTNSTVPYLMTYHIIPSTDSHGSIDSHFCSFSEKMES